jgi:hypothetical protein
MSAYALGGAPLAFILYYSASYLRQAFSLTQQAIEISDSHKATIAPHMNALGATTPEGYVQNYARSNLAEAKTKGKL